MRAMRVVRPVVFIGAGLAPATGSLGAGHDGSMTR
jgi:hypothetical protein